VTLPTIDVFTLLGESLFGYSQSADELLARLDSVDVEQAVVCPVKPPGYHLAPANDLVAEAAAREPRFIGLARVDPNQGEAAVRELERAITGLGLRGLFLHPWEENFRVNGPLIDPLVAMCAEWRLPLLIATGYPWVSEAAQVGDVARRYPSVPIIMTHGGQINISGLGQMDAFEVLRRRPNVSMETSGVYRQDFVLDVASQLGPARVLFGSNSPLMDCRLEVERVRQALDLAEDARRLMLAGNARRIFKLDSNAPLR
jgi:predicted TIM-barrel fold metal-dependent hydrolase